MEAGRVDAIDAVVVSRHGVIELTFECIVQLGRRRNRRRRMRMRIGRISRRCVAATVCHCSACTVRQVDRDASGQRECENRVQLGLFQQSVATLLLQQSVAADSIQTRAGKRGLS